MPQIRRRNSGVDAARMKRRFSWGVSTNKIQLALLLGQGTITIKSPTGLLHTCV